MHSGPLCCGGDRCLNFLSEGMTVWIGGPIYQCVLKQMVIIPGINDVGDLGSVARGHLHHAQQRSDAHPGAQEDAAGPGLQHEVAARDPGLYHVPNLEKER